MIINLFESQVSPKYIYKHQGQNRHWFKITLTNGVKCLLVLCYIDNHEKYEQICKSKSLTMKNITIKDGIATIGNQSLVFMGPKAQYEITDEILCLAQKCSKADYMDIKESQSTEKCKISIVGKISEVTLKT